MFYVFDCTPEHGSTEETCTPITMHLSAGIIHQVDVLFQLGCVHAEFIKIFEDGSQLWPSNPEESLRGNATIVSFREFYELTPGNNILKVKSWTDLDALDIKEVIVQIGLLPKAIIQPLSFDELLAAAAGIE